MIPWEVFTAGGRLVNLRKLQPEDISLESIAHSLANQCRFAGHTREHYSVAQHSVLCAESVPEPYKAAALFHDAAEAFIGDIIRPVKSALPGEFLEIERSITAKIYTAFGIPYPAVPSAVKEVDDWLMSIEIDALVHGHTRFIVPCASPDRARELFLNTWAFVEDRRRVREFREALT